MHRSLQIFSMWLMLSGISFPLNAHDLFDEELSKPPGRLVDIGGYRLHIDCRGAGSPVVILDAGLGGFSMDWLYVQQLLQDETMVCAYDRAGYGWSDPGPAPRVTEQIVDELVTLLDITEIKPPYILVGHSFGGFNIQYFARLKPASIAGIVLVDASHPQQTARLPELPGKRKLNNYSSLITFFDPRVVYKYYPESLWNVVGRMLSTPKAIATQQRELINFTMSADQVQHAGKLPDVPLVVITRGQHVWPDDPRGLALEKSWQELQRDLLAGNARGRQVIAEKSGHLIHLDQPEIVARVVHDVLVENCIDRQAKNTAVETGQFSC